MSSSLLIKYHPINVEDNWKIDVIQEIIQIKNQILEDFSNPELEEILQHICSA